MAWLPSKCLLVVLLFVLNVSTNPVAAGRHVYPGGESFIGWKGEVYESKGAVTKKTVSDDAEHRAEIIGDDAPVERENEEDEKETEVSLLTKIKNRSNENLDDAAIRAKTAEVFGTQTEDSKETMVEKEMKHAVQAPVLRQSEDKEDDLKPSKKATEGEKIEAPKLKKTIRDRDAEKPWIELLSWKPRAYLYHNFMKSDEADYLIALATPQMKNSMVVDDSTASGFAQSDYRTSYGTFLRRNQNDVLKDIQKRLAKWTHLPEINQEDMQILRYGSGQQYRPHMDVLESTSEGRRLATVLMYLKDCEDGGETAFPYNSEWLHPKRAKEMGPWSECAEGHLAVKARKGDALLFFSLLPSGEEDPHSEHAGCPVLNDAVKYTATVWIHDSPFRPEEFEYEPSPVRDAGDCEDFDDNCVAWEQAGHCESNKLYMQGDLVNDGDMGACRKSCGVCDVCEENDRDCYFGNRKKASYLVADDLWPLGGERTYKFPQTFDGFP